MKTNNETAALALVLLLGLIAGHAQAATMIGGYMTDAAVADPLVYGGSHSHAVWFAEDDHDYVFSQGSGQFLEFDDGSALFTGFVYSDTAPTRGYEIALYLAGRTESAPTGSPKRELFDSAYSENGGPVDVATWYYYTSFSGTLTGVGDLAGTVLAITQRGPAFQIGPGANGKNAQFGASAWFDASNADTSLRGDFNLNLQVIPVPAALPLLLSAFGVLGMFGRRR